MTLIVISLLFFMSMCYVIYAIDRDETEGKFDIMGAPKRDRERDNLP